MALGSDVFTLDGTWKGKFAGYYRGQDGRVYLVTRKLRILPGSSRTFKLKRKRVAHKYLDYLYKKAEVDPNKYKPIIALLEDGGYDYLPLEDPKNEVLISSDKVMIVQRNKDWLPTPLVSLLENSPSQRDLLAELYTMYTQYLKFERPQLHHQLMLYKQLDRANQRLINTLMYENDQLVRTTEELAQVVNNAYRQISDLIHAVEFFHELYEIYKKQSAGWKQGVDKMMEAIPTLVQLVDEIRKQMSRALDLSMELDVSEWTGKQAMLEAIKRYREQLRQIEKQAMEATQAPARLAALKGAGSSASGGENVGREEGSSSSGEGSEESKS